MQNRSENAVWKERSKRDCKCFVRIVKVFPDKTETTLTSNALVVYPVDMVLRISFAVYQRWLIEKGRNFMGLLPSKMKMKTCEGMS